MRERAFCPIARRVEHNDVGFDLPKTVFVDLRAFGGTAPETQQRDITHGNQLVDNFEALGLGKVDRDAFFALQDFSPPASGKASSWRM